jgi:trk system potassium uptake protein
LNLRLVLSILGLLLVFSGLAMLLPLAFSLYYNDGVHLPLIEASLVNIGVGLCLYLLTRGAGRELRHREGFAIVTFGWLTLGIFGSLPFIFSGVLYHPVDAIFETLSGYTTTGASVLNDIESVPEGILFWRSLTHWLGGMGVLVLVTAILPYLGVGGMQLIKAEAPGPTTDRLTPRITSTAKLLWIVYLILSLVQTILLIIGGLSLFEALCQMFGTMSTGGFSTRNASIAAFDSVYIETVIIVFMLLSGTSFSLHFRFLAHQDWRGFSRDEEFRFYSLVVLAGTLLVMLNLVFYHDMEAGEGLRKSIFQVVSITTTTGFVTADFDQWPAFSKLFLLVLMFVGGCAGSTGGAMKHVRVLILLKHGLREMRRQVFPGRVLPLKVSGRAVPNDIVTNVLGFFLLYILVFVVAGFLVASLGVVDMVTAFASVAATLGNIGPGFGGVGAVKNYAYLPSAVKVILSLCMVIGRLEIYTVLILFLPSFWTKK